MPVEAILPAIIGAVATITAALIQLYIGWRKEMRANANHVPLSKRTRRGMVAAIVVLMLASAFGGYSFSQYLVKEAHKDVEEKDREIRAQLERLTAIAERLERSMLASHPGEPVVPRANAASPDCVAGNPEKPCPEQTAVAPVTPK